MVKVNNSLSVLPPLRCRLPQGSILSPTLFQIFINNLLTLPLHSSVHAYADDTSFSLANNDPSLLQTQLDHDMAVIQTWCSENRMIINTKKSHYIVVNKPKNFTFTLKFNNHDLEQKSTSKQLGFYINDSLDWHDHINHISKKLHQTFDYFTTYAI